MGLSLKADVFAIYLYTLKSWVEKIKVIILVKLGSSTSAISGFKTVDYELYFKIYKDDE